MRFVLGAATYAVIGFVFGFARAAWRDWTHR